MAKQKIKQDNGVAGLTILLSLIVMLFIIGLLIMIFTIMTEEMKVSTYDTTTSQVANETKTTVDEKGELLARSTLRDVVCTVLQVRNATVGGASAGGVIDAGNYTVSGCRIYAVDSTFNNTDWNVTYSYVYEADNGATNTMNDTMTAIAKTTDWFDIFIVIGAMVVLILLTVIIITAIRSSGMVQSGSTQGANQVGTA
jgi:uncharacterized membrane protein